MTNQSMIDADQYALLCRVLERQDVDLSAAAAHGSLCAWLGVIGDGRDWAWLDMPAEAPVSEHLLHDEKGFLLRLIAETGAHLDEGEFTFQPLLPTVDAPLLERAVAMGEWCDGFLGGLGMAGLRDRVLSAMGREALVDLGNIARTRIDVADGEADESAFEEVLEFVRIGAVLIYEELRAARSKQDQHHGLHSTH